MAQLRVDPELPIAARADEIAAALHDHQVIVVAGETGSGKTTQLPKICLAQGRGRIAHTQPRRIAARTVAERIADELGVSLGDEVGYRVRFTRKAGRDTALTVMTDGVLLNEIGRDRDLRRYDTIIVDEAHERSLNIDFLLGYLAQLLARRPDLKVIVTSATIDTARFAAHFADREGRPAPIVEVSGRTYPVEIRYRPLIDETDSDVAAEPRDQVEGICDAVLELLTDPVAGLGDVLVFCAGEREIRDAARALGEVLERELRTGAMEILPLYARLSAAEQHRVFAAHPGRRVVLATNVAETSLTVPGIRSVVDAGTARISRYSARTKVQRLPIEPISRASADQRAGRCGRVAPGVAIRLYGKDDYEARPEFTEPEILRTNLAAVILQMADARLGDIASFPFVEAPDASRIADGLRLLTELGALRTERSGRPGGPGRGRPHVVTGRDGGPVLSTIGHRLARIPLDPRLGRMLVEGERQGCLAEIMIIAAGLSIPDPRERPTGQEEAADTLHRRFWAPLREGSDDDQQPTPDGSDFIAYLRLWSYLRKQRKALSGNGFRRMCRDEFLHYLRVREWQDLHAQLRDITKELELSVNAVPAGPDAVHTAVLSGLLSNIGLADLRAEEAAGRTAGRSRGGARRRRPLREYLGTRGARFAINPGSSVARKPPELVMAAELVETSRLWARTVAGLEPAWVEQVGEHLISRSYSEPHWSAKSGTVVATERVSLLGVPIIGGRNVSYGRIDPAEARAIFISSALVEGQWRTRHHFFHRNAETRRRAEELEERSRRRDLLVDDATIAAFYAARIPDDIVSVAHFDRWWRDRRRETPELLDLTLADLTHAAAGQVDLADFPDALELPAHEGDPVRLVVRYSFEPGAGHDGAEVRLPVQLLNRVDGAPLTWSVPGFRDELATELIRSLPKQIRTQLVPAPDRAKAALAWLAEHPGPATETLPAALGRAVRQLNGVQIADDAWDPGRVPAHLTISVVITDGERELARGEDLAALREQLAPAVAQAVQAAAAAVEVRGATSWSFGALAEQVEVSPSPGGEPVIGYPALRDDGASVAVVVAESVRRQHALHRLGLRRLVLLGTPDPTRSTVAHLSARDKLLLGYGPYAAVPELLADARLAAIGDLILDHTDPDAVRDEQAYARLCDAVRQEGPQRMRAVVTQAAQILDADRTAQQAIATLPDGPARADMTEQRANLVFPGFLAATPAAHRADLRRYLAAITARAEAWPTVRSRDDDALAVITDLEARYAAVCDRHPRGLLPGEVAEAGWLLEELRVSLFAQRLGTRVSVSAKRVGRAIDEAAGA